MQMGQFIYPLALGKRPRRQFTAAAFMFGLVCRVRLRTSKYDRAHLLSPSSLTPAEHLSLSLTHDDDLSKIP